MDGTRLHRGLAAAWKLSTLALLALALIPVGAWADSSGVQYEDAPPSPYGGSGSTGTGQSEPPASSSSAPDGGTGAAGAVAGSSSGSAGKKASSKKADRASGGKADRTGQRSQDNGSSGNEASAGPAIGNTDGAAAQTDGGSSPLIPILIAIAVLAAISVGAVMWRQRRQRAETGEPASSQAG